ncbi:Protein-glutamate methylesterase/protein-glutamine glutaminase [Baekduia alba]|uniref:chemotaxis-specific protein-glutamate methyltransferase CheB n=1 Tax=Baekduia alba TaxID=2997333 RepID=UPI0023409169|nr:chemotaxis-specific protein-glutamate methyltransferase CheB [Baekduia alba]WCB91382.1 Protein-glutamate methylesterase/protein-glutamine glutaminase [Baekduia alba]
MLAAARTAKPSRILVADDSTFMRRLLTQALRDAGFDVVGEAADGDEALSLYRELRPDAMTLDLAMPGMDGIGVLRALRGERSSLPVVVVSAFSPAHGARAVDALAEGAFDLVAKPAFGEPLETFVSALREKVTAAASAAAPKAPTRRAATDAARAARVTPTNGDSAVARLRARRVASSSASAGKKVVLIATSTGGPRALAELIPNLPSPLGAGGMIVQHMPAGFTASLAQRLDRSSKLTVVEAAGGEALKPDTLLLAPGGSHLRLADDGAARLTDEAAVGGLRPRADLTIADAAKLYGERLLLVVMTGMGKDGLEGAKAVRARGGRIIAEAESSCTVYGMPRAIVEAQLADEVVPLDQLADAIRAELGDA